MTKLSYFRSIRNNYSDTTVVKPPSDLWMPVGLTILYTHNICNREKTSRMWKIQWKQEVPKRKRKQSRLPSG